MGHKMYCKVEMFDGTEFTFTSTVELLSMLLLFSFAFLRLHSSLPITLLSHDISLKQVVKNETHWNNVFSLL